MFTLISNDTLFKKVVTGIGGEYVNRKWVPSNSTTYEAFSGLWEPFGDGESGLVLPAGVSSEASIVVYSEDQSLVVNCDIAGREAVGTIIYLDDPDVTPNTPAFIVEGRSEWKANASFSLLGTSTEYLAVRVEKK